MDMFNEEECEESAQPERFVATSDLEDILKNLLHKEEKKSKNLILKSALIKEYFSDDYSRDEMVEVICTLLKNWKQGGEG